MTPQIDLSDWYRPKIDRKTLRALSQRSDWPGIRHVIIYFSALFISGYLAYVTWGTWWTVLWFLVYGNIFGFSNGIWHETNHGTFFKSPRLNKIFWHISSYMTAFEPIRWKWSHYHHHSYTLHMQTPNPIDVEVVVTRPADVVGFFLRFLPFGSLVQSYKGFQYLHKEILLHALGRKTDSLMKIVPAEEWPNVRRWSQIHVAIWLAAIVASILTASWLPVLYIVLPNFYGNTLPNACGLTQHAGLAEDDYDHRNSTPTVILGPILSFLYCRMEYHIEHHVFPMVPSHNLPQLHQAIKDQLPEPAISIVGAHRDIVPAVIKQGQDTEYFIKVQLPA